MLGRPRPPAGGADREPLPPGDPGEAGRACGEQGVWRVRRGGCPAGARRGRRRSSPPFAVHAGSSAGQALRHRVRCATRQRPARRPRLAPPEDLLARPRPPALLRSAGGWGCDERNRIRPGCVPGAEMVIAHTGGRDTCDGDSGGPVFEWRCSRRGPTWGWLPSPAAPSPARAAPAGRAGSTPGSTRCPGGSTRRSRPGLSSAPTDTCAIAPGELIERERGENDWKSERARGCSEPGRRGSQGTCRGLPEDRDHHERDPGDQDRPLEGRGSVCGKGARAPVRCVEDRSSAEGEDAVRLVRP